MPPNCHGCKIQGICSLLCKLPWFFFWEQPNRSAAWYFTPQSGLLWWWMGGKQCEEPFTPQSGPQAGAKVNTVWNFQLTVCCWACSYLLAFLGKVASPASIGLPCSAVFPASAACLPSLLVVPKSLCSPLPLFHWKCDRSLEIVFSGASSYLFKLLIFAHPNLIEFLLFSFPSSNMVGSFLGL